jgi:hypothetical protein
VTGRVLLVGLGDLGQRLAERLVNCPAVGELILASRRPAEQDGLASLLSVCGSAFVRSIALDAARFDMVAQVLDRERPQLVLQCASLMSPWHLIKRQDPIAVALSQAGFAIQLPAQLPMVMTVMEGARAAGFTGTIVNCSYPDVTHPVLACLGLAPTIGIGNAGMIESRVRAALRAEPLPPGMPGRAIPMIRVLAHHAHVASAMRSDAVALASLSRPRVYLGEDGERRDSLAFAGNPLPANSSLNMLTAFSAVPILRALFPGGVTVRTSAPGPLGLPGGYPVEIRNGHVSLDLPSGTDLAEVTAFQNLAARGDGVESIAADGTVSFTAAAREAVQHLDPALAEPLAPREAWERFRRLAEVLQG